MEEEVDDSDDAEDGGKLEVDDDDETTCALLRSAVEELGRDEEDVIPSPREAESRVIRLFMDDMMGVVSRITRKRY